MASKATSWFEAPLENKDDLLTAITAFWESRGSVVQTIVVSSKAQYEALESLLAEIEAPVSLVHGDGKEGRPRVPPGKIWLAAEKTEEVRDESGTNDS